LKTNQPEHHVKVMQKFLLAGCLVLSTLFMYNGLAQTQVQSRWRDQGTPNLTLADYSIDDSIFYLISNNEDYVYLNLIVPDVNDQKKILLFGLTVWVDPKGKKRKDIGIMFPYRTMGRRTKPSGPVPDGADPFMEDLGQATGVLNPRRRAMTNFDAVKYRLAEISRVIGLSNYTDTAKFILIPAENPHEVHGWMAYDSTNLLHYMIALPLDKILLNTADSKSGFSLGIETGYLKPEQAMSGPGGPGAGMGRPGGGPGGRPGGAGGMGRPGGPGGGGGARPGGGRGMMSPQQRQGMMEQRQALSMPTKFWIKKIRLAERQ
jgi:hypothetical protein